VSCGEITAAIETVIINMYNIKRLFKHYLSQLEIITAKIPADIFAQSLTEGMFSLEMNAKIAANFVLRGYCPLLPTETVSFYQQDQKGKESVSKQITETLQYLEDLPEVHEFDDSKLITDKAGFSDIALCQSEYIHLYVFPNFLFHISMVYAIAKANGVELSKSDFDGLHSYPSGFSFVK